MLSALERAAAKTHRRPVLRDVFKTGDAPHLPADHRVARCRKFSTHRLRAKTRERRAISIRTGRRHSKTGYARISPRLAKKTRVHRTGIPLENFPFAQREPPAENGAWKFLQACRLISKKGLRTSLRAFAAFVKNHAPGASFTIAGEGPMLDELRQLASELG